MKTATLKNFLTIFTFLLLSLVGVSSPNAVTVSVTALNNGLASSPLSASATNQALIGFTVQAAGGSTTFSGITFSLSSTPSGKLSNFRIYRSSDNTFATTADNVLLSGATVATTATQLQITGLTETASATSSFYFIVADVSSTVTSATTAVKLSTTQANVTLSGGGTVNAFTLSSASFSFYGVCDPSTPSYVVDLTGNPDSAWVSPAAIRSGLCCGLNTNDNCITFLLTLDPNAERIRFDVASGAMPSGSLGWSLNCGPENPVGQNICISGAGPHRITFCKPGGNINTYKITSISKPSVTPVAVVSSSCTSTITAQSFVPSSVTWKSISPGTVGQYNGYLSCLSGCTTTVATYNASAPASVLYQVSGTPQGGCSSVTATDTVRVFFVNDKTVTITPANPTICFGGVNTTITANVTGGAPPYKYSWSNGATTQSISVGVGTYTVTVSDATSCPVLSSSVTVTANPSPITANAGPDVSSCVNNPNVVLTGSIVQAKGGVWSGGAGTYSPSNTSLTVTYIPTAAEKVGGTTITHTLTTTGNGSCPASTDDAVLTIVPSPVVNTGGNKTVCANNPATAISATVTNATGGTWTGGAGTYFPNSSSLVMTYTPSAAEITAGVANLTLTSTGNGSCNAVSSPLQITITPAPTVTLTTPTTVCANNSVMSLTAAVTVATGGTWTTSGSGTFANANALNTTYTPSTADKTAGTVTLTFTTTGNGTCNPVSASKTISITSAPTVFAGPGQTVCANNAVVSLNGTVTGATGGTWTTSGSGTFANATALATTYTPSAADNTAGSVTLTLTTTGNGNCNAVTSTMTVTITPAPTANAGAAATVCGNNASVPLSGSVTVATGGTWSGGAGAYAPNNNTLNATYTPSAAEITAGTVTLTLTTTGNGSCAAVTSTKTISITPAPTVNAGPDRTVCNNNASVNLTATETVATGVTWTTSGSGTFSNANSLTTTYTPSAADKTSGAITLTATTTGNGTCNAVSDQMNIAITPSPTVNPGPNQTVCANNAVVNLNGTVTIASGGKWTSSGSGVFASSTALTTTYTPSASDKTAGTVTLTLTTTGNGSCLPVSAPMTVTITPAPTVNAGAAATVCGNNASVALNGTVTVATGGTWSGGTGTFAPGASSLNATYTPSAAEITAGTVTLTLTTTGNGSCTAVSSAKSVTITPAPTVNAGADQTVCANNANVTLSAVKTVATGISWTTSGTGTFGNSTALATTYTPSAADKAAGTVTLTITTTGNGTCNSVTDDMVVTITPAPTVSAGSNDVVCANNASVNIAGTVTVATGGTWTTSGSGTFANANALSTVYTPSAADKTAGTVTLTLTTTGNGKCTAVSSSKVVTITSSPTADAGIDKQVCSNNPNIGLAGAITVASGGTWSGGSGTFVPNNNSLNTTYTPSAAEISAGVVSLIFTSTGNGNCFAAKDTMLITIFPAPTVNAGSAQSICVNNPTVALAGIVGNSTVTTTKAWSGGTGTFNPNVNTLNATYTPAAAEVTAGSFTLTLTATRPGCNAVSSNVIMNFSPSPTASAGPDQTVCSNNPTVSLAGNVTVASGGTWTTSGTGNFSNPNTLTTTYYPSAADKAAGTVTLTLTSTGNGNCFAVSDQMVINITPAPTSNAGPDQTVCANKSSVTLAGQVTIGTGGVWSGGTGTFTPNANTLNATYIPSAAEKTAGSVTLTLTTTGNGNCIAVTDQMVINITPAPTVSAGGDKSICANNPSAVLDGTVTIATGGTWTGGNGTFSPNANTVDVTYTPTAAEITDGSVVLTLVSTGNGLCNAVSDQITLTVTPAPTVNAGPDMTVCSNATNVPLAGTVTVATGGKWTTSGSGTFSPSATALNASYVPSAADKTAGTVTLTLTTTGNGNCVAISDQMVITITPLPTSSAGVNQTVCTNDLPVKLSATGSPSTWSGGAGTFSPNNTALNAAYTPTAAEITAGSVTLTLTPKAIGGCATPPATSVTITLPPGPIVSAGPDVTICGDVNSIALPGTVTNATGGTWTTTGTGTFSPNANTKTATYIPSAQDKSDGTVTLTLTSTGNGACTAQQDDAVITITPAPKISAGPDLTRCADVSSVPVTGTVTVASGVKWTTSGTGTFTPNATSLSVTYIPSSADTAAKSVTLTITSTGNGTCNPVSDQMVIGFTPAPTVNAGPDQTICADKASATLGGSFSVATGVIWTTDGTGTFSPNSTTLNASYFPSAADTVKKTINFTLTTTGNGTCKSVSDQMVLKITPAPTINAGPDVSVCADKASVILNGASKMIATGATWTSSGSGTFAPSANTLNPTYNLSVADKTAGSIVLTATSTGNGTCNAVSDQMIITVTPAPTVNAGPDKTICADAAGVSLAGSVTIAAGTTWTTSGTGTFSPNATSLNATYNPSAADKTSGTVTITLTTTGNGLCNPVSDNMVLTITPAPTVTPGPNQTICADAAGVTLSGSKTVAAGGIWTTSGTGTFSPNATSLNATYVPSTADTAARSVTLTLSTTGNGTCNAVSGNLTVTITPAPTVNAGANSTVCANNPAVALSGSITTATGGTWTGGNGTYNPNANTLKATYTPSAAEIAAGTVTLTLTTTGNGTCKPVSDSKVITITPAPVVNAGADRIICANNSTISLAGTVTGATGGVWSGGTGTYAPGNTALNAAYTPSAAEIAAGTVTLTLTSTGNGNCLPVTDQMVITITPAPTVNPGAAQTVCANNTQVSLAGTVSVATGGIWTTSGSGIFAPGASALTATYTPSAADIAAGTVKLTLTSTGNGNCNAVSATKAITITPAPTVNAGGNRTICADASSLPLTAVTTVAGGVSWATSGTGTFTPDAVSATVSYIPSATDKTNGAVTLTVTTTGNGTCNAVSQNILVTITPAPTVNAGPDQTICADKNSISLGGAVTNATGGTWTSSGTGVFSPSASTLNAFYTPSAADTVAHTVTLTLTTTGNGLCNPVTDDMVLTITPAPSVDAGPDQTICADATGAALNGSYMVATGVKWTTSGSGTFAPNAVTANATYKPSAADITAGIVDLTLTTTGNGTCNTVSDKMRITITPAPTINAGPDLTMCVDEGSIVINGSVTVAGGVVWSTASGTGTFSPDANSLLVTFTPSATQITNGIARITLTSTGNGTCNAVSDQMFVNILPAPVVDAGPNKSICADAASVALAGTITNATGGHWTTSGTGTFSPNANTLNATYIPSAADKVNGNLTLTLTSTGNGRCQAYSSSMNLKITPVPTVDAGPSTICANSSSVALNGTVTVAAGGTWTTTGTGAFAPSPTVLSTSYVPSPADFAAGSVKLKLTTRGNGACTAVSDSINLVLQAQPSANAGADQVVCANNANVILAGVVNTATAVWTSTGGGAFSPNATTVNATYTPSAIDKVNGTVTLTLTTTGVGSCTPASDDMKVTITTAPTANAGPDKTVCANNANVGLSGTVTVATGGTWTSTGTGTFLPNANTLKVTYVPSAADITSGKVDVTLTTTGNGLCSPVSDQMTITITPAPVVSGGGNQTVCADAAGVGLNGSVTIAGGVKWTSTGAGTFSPNNTTKGAIYYLTTADKSAGSVKLYITSTSNGSCKSVKDSVIVTIPPAPVVTAFATNSCSSAPSIPLGGTVTNATGVKWSTMGTGTFAPDDVTINASYVPSAGDIAAGNVTLTLTSTGNGTCNPVSASFVLNIQPAPVVDAGPDRTVCANNNAVSLGGSFSNSTGAKWTGTGSGTFSPNALTPTATYTPSAADITAGSVKLYLTSTGNGICSPATDSMTITITPAPTVDAGPAVICSTNPTLALHGVVTTAAGAQWTTSGSGTFTPNDTDLNATYNLSPADLTTGSITITLTSTGNGSCLAVSDQIVVNVANSPTVNAGSDKSICSNNASAGLNGSFANATGVTWGSTGTGTFSPGTTSAIATYIASAADTAAGKVKLYLTTTGNGVCSAVTDTMVLTITPSPTVDLGPGTICSVSPSINLKATLTVATSGTWTTSGSGTFSNANALATSYTPSAADKTAGAVIITFTTAPTAGGCSPVSRSVHYFIIGAPSANAGTDKTVCGDVAGVAITGSVSNAGGGVWSIVSGSGTFSAAASSLVNTYVPSSADTAAGSAKLVLTTTGNGSCIAHSDTMTITFTPAPYMNAGVDRTICADAGTINLAATLTVATGATWSTTGMGTFGNPSQLTTTYTPSAVDTAAHHVNLILTSTGNGTCNAVTDTVVVTITPAPSISTPAVICSDAAAVPVTGMVTISTGGTWTTTGSGIFTPNADSLSVNYVPSAADRVMGSVVLKLTSTGNGLCKAISSNTILNLVPPPSANAGADQNICAAAGTVNVSGSVVTATGGTWTTTGTGTFTAPNSLTTVYKLSKADTAAHVVTLILTTTGNNGCTPASDSLTIYMTPAPVAIVNAGNDKVICADATIVDLDGKIYNAAGGVWTYDGNGIFTPNEYTLNAKYVPDAVDRANGFITFVLESTGNGICTPVRDTMTLTITQVPTVAAGSDQTVCSDVTGVTVSGTVNIATGGMWTSSGTGTFTPNANTLNATYHPTLADFSDSTIVLTLTTTGNGTCQPVTSTKKLYFTPAPKVDAGPDQIVCSDAGSVSLQGTVTVATGGQWSSPTGGTFGNATNLVTTYALTKADSINGGVMLTLTSTGNGTCMPVTDNVKITVTTGPTVNAGSDQKVCADVAGVVLNGSKTVATGAMWTTSGSGAFYPNEIALNATYVPSLADTAAHNITLVLTTTGNGTCNPALDSMTVNITPAPVVDAGPDQTICADAANVALNGNVMVATGGVWTTSGTGTFANANMPVTAYTPSAADRKAGVVTLTLTSTGNGTCNPVTDHVTIFITPAPTINAGLDQVVCADAGTVSISGMVTVATGGIWSSPTGGTFAKADSLSTQYSITSADSTNGSVLLTLTSTGNGTCVPVTDQVLVTITPVPTANANINQTVCADAAGVKLVGAVTVATGGMWSSNGSGTFSPAPNALNAVYKPSAADTAARNVILTLTTTGNGTCKAVKDTMTVTITPAPIANAGPDMIVCGNNANVTLAGHVITATGGAWTTSGTGTFSNASSLSAVYTPSAADISAGAVTLTLTTTGNGTCNAVKDEMTISFTTIPVVNAGADLEICGNNAKASLNGTVTVATGGKWTTSGSGTFSPDANTLKTTYVASAADITAGTVTLTLTSTGNGTCSSVSDNMVITVTSIPTANAGSPATICADNTSGVPLAGAVTIANGGVWTTSGTGTFSPNAAMLNAVYYPSAADKANGKVGLTLTTTGNGNCLAVNSTAVLNINKMPVVNAGVDKSICADAAGAKITGTVTNAGGGVWSTSGTGTFAPAVSNLTVTYQPSAADRSAGLVTLTLTSTSNGLCNAVTDQMILKITPAPTANAGADITMCADASSTSLKGAVTVASGGLWITSGSGSFMPSAASLNASYLPSQNDKKSGKVTLTLISTGNGTCNFVQDNVDITIVPAPIVSVGNGNMCADSTGVILNGSVQNAAGGQWMTSGSGVFSPNAYALNASYTPSKADTKAGFAVLTLVSTGNGTCNAIQNSMNLIITPLPVSDGGKDENICRGTSVTLSGRVFPDNSYNWFSLKGQLLSSTNIVNVTANADTAFVYKATDAKGCATYDTVKVNAVDPPSFNLPVMTCFRNGLSLNLDADPSFAPAFGNFQWYRNDTLLYGMNDTIIGVTGIGAYMVEYNFGRCSVFDTTLVKPAPVLHSRDTLVCTSTAVNIQTTQITGDKYKWTRFGNGTITGSDTLNPVSIVSDATPNDSTMFVVTVTAPNTCSSIDTITVKTVPPPALVLADDSACVGQSITLTGKPSNITNSLSKYNWYVNGVHQSISDTTQSLTVTKPGQYVLYYGVGGCSAKDTADLTFIALPVITNQEHDNCFEDHTIDVDAGAGYRTYQWSSKGVSPDTITGVTTDRIFTAKGGGTYNVTVTNFFGCANTAKVKVNDVCPPRLFIPKAFIPGADKDNDPTNDQDAYFKVFGKYLVNFEFTIFNRWGEIIYHSTNPQDVWDGAYMGEIMQEGVYPWTIKYEGGNEKFKGPYMESGSVTIIR